MSDADPRPCPAPEFLGAYVERMLQPKEQAAVERHLLHCAECLLVVRETSRYLADHDDEDDRSASPVQRRQYIVTAAAVAILCLMFAWYAGRTTDPLRKLRKVSTRLPLRPVEGRIAGFPHADFSTGRSDARPAVSFALRAEADHVQALRHEDARTLHARAVAALVLGDAAEAVGLFERAVRLEPDNAWYWNDLAAAHIASASVGPSRFTAARAAAEHALAIDSTLSAAYFNLGITCEHLGLYDTAIAAFGRSVRYDRDPEWAAEADRRGAFLRSFR